jgi:exosome complex component RRP40
MMFVAAFLLVSKNASTSTKRAWPAGAQRIISEPDPPHSFFLLPPPSLHRRHLDQSIQPSHVITDPPFMTTILVLPGDNVTKKLVDPSGAATAATAVAAKLGTGLRRDARTDQVYATQAGTLERGRGNKSNVYFVRTSLRRYRPAVEDRVIGIVQGRAGPDGAGGELYAVHIHASHPAHLSNLQFEGATKRNKPQFTTGTLVYARVAKVFPDNTLDPLLSCINGPNDGGIPRKDWMTNEGCYGELKGGTCCDISTGLARQLLHPHDNVVLNCLAETKIPFEIAIGVNGILWLHSTHPIYTVMLQNAIQNSEILTASQVRSMVSSLKSTADQQIRKHQEQEQRETGGGISSKNDDSSMDDDD